VKKPILIWGAPDRVDQKSTYEQAFVESGHNLGNILIGNGVRSVLDGEMLNWQQVPTPQEANERCGHVVIPAANFLWKEFDFGYMADYLERTVLPVTIVGLGAQTNDRSISSPIHANTLRLVKLVAERSAFLGVRGFYTAEVLAAHGIHNVEIIGCPSLYTTRNPTIRVDIKRLVDLGNVTVNFSRRVAGHSFRPECLRTLENAVLEFALQYNCDFVAQDELEELALCADNQETQSQAITEYFSSAKPKEVLDYFRRNTKFFRDVESWGAYIRTRSATVGSRFHGNLISLINGVPALTIVHDSRTMEMCSLLGMPRIHVCELDQSRMSVRDLSQTIQSADFTQFERSYRALYARFVKFLGCNGLSHRLACGSRSGDAQ